MSFSSSAYSGGMAYLREEIPMSEEVVVLGISLYVLGFALGRVHSISCIARLC